MDPVIGLFINAQISLLSAESLQLSLKYIFNLEHDNFERLFSISKCVLERS